MYFYRVGYKTHEESYTQFLVSPDWYSEDEFNDLVESHLAEMFFSREWRYERRLDYLSFDLVKHLTEEHGFFVLEPHQQWIGFGWCDLYDPDDWKSCREKADIRLTERILKLQKEMKEVEPTISE